MNGRRGISCHSEFDDLRHWQFSRSSGLPRDYFRERSRIHPLWVASAVLLAFLVLFIVL